MSWKIYNGLILRHATLEEALVKAKELRRRCLSLASDKLCQLASERLVLKADMALNVCWLTDEDDETPPVMEEIKAAKRRVAGEGVRCPEWDHTLELAFIPWHGHVLVLYFLENDPGYHDAMTELGFEEFYYYSNTDRPDHVTEREWLARRDAWHHSGYMDYEAPSSFGLCFGVVNWNDLMEVPVWWLARQDTQMNPEARKRAVAEQLISPELSFHFNRGGETISDMMKRSMRLSKERTPDVLLAEDVELDFHDLF